MIANLPNRACCNTSDIRYLCEKCAASYNAAHQEPTANAVTTNAAMKVGALRKILDSEEVRHHHAYKAVSGRKRSLADLRSTLKGLPDDASLDLNSWPWEPDAAVLVSEALAKAPAAMTPAAAQPAANAGMIRDRITAALCPEQLTWNCPQDDSDNVLPAMNYFDPPDLGKLEPPAHHYAPLPGIPPNVVTPPWSGAGGPVATNADDGLGVLPLSVHNYDRDDSNNTLPSHADHVRTLEAEERRKEAHFRPAGTASQAWAAAALAGPVE